MGQYRTSRNLEASIIDYLEAELQAEWSNINVTKVWSKIVKGKISLPAVLIRCGTTGHNRVEAGGSSTWREPLIMIDIFATDDGQRLDIKDFIIEKMKGGCTYYNYEIENGQVKTKTANGRIRVQNIDDDPINFEVDKDNLAVHDRFRHLLTLTVATGKVES